MQTIFSIYRIVYIHKPSVVNVVSSCMEICCPLEERKHPGSVQLQEAKDLEYTGYISRNKYNALKSTDKVCGA